MKIWKTILPAAAVFLMAGQALAQSGDEDRAREMEQREAEFAERMREAEERLAEAAQRVAELSTERLGSIGDAQRYAFEFSNKPRLGINIQNDGSNTPVEGVSIMSVSPGSAAADAGLRAGDIITSVNNEPMSAASPDEANVLLLDFMRGVEEGDKLTVEYLRGGNIGSVEVEPRIVDASAFVWMHDGPDFRMPRVPDVQVAPEIVERFRYSFGGWHGGWGDMEVVELTEGLGRYFGTDEGLLVISAPESNALQLQDGDVIQSIDGRSPSSVNHCMRILGSYQPGEKVVLNIMRDKKPQTIEIEMPDNRSSHHDRVAPSPVRPAVAPVPVAPPLPDDHT